MTMLQTTWPPSVRGASRCLVVCLVILLAACAESPEELVARLGSRDPRELKEVTDKLLQYDSDVVPALREGLSSQKWRARFMCAQLLGTLRARVALDDLIQVLADSNAGVVERSAFALGQIAAEEAALPLILILDHPSIDVALSATTALEQIGSPLAMPALLKRLDDPSARLRLRSMQALGSCIDSTQAVADTIYGRLVRALDDSSHVQRVAAIAGLRGFAYRGVARWLVKAAEHEQPEVAYVAVQALGEVRGSAHPAWWGVVRPDTSRIPVVLMRVVRHATRDEIRAKAIQSLGQLQTTAAVPLLDSLKSTERGQIQIAAGRALRSMAGEGWGQAW
ncbi:MAG: HEAT repeat domain-containing protein [Gemmatimonadetes bacterium]|jgi:HEAT repeat protein|nr:HEAT repeat domain-containing protein [Gemmatimonadota bacterium]MBT6144626.1 HEAT repeat domain-containing protein [Gemmatimonadota bacterium]MBT7863920.1 HEAT repeat domain-containing protein [Gemmatimonadota bacterium]